MILNSKIIYLRDVHVLCVCLFVEGTMHSGLFLSLHHQWHVLGASSDVLEPLKGLEIEWLAQLDRISLHSLWYWQVSELSVSVRALHQRGWLGSSMSFHSWCHCTLTQSPSYNAPNLCSPGNQFTCALLLCMYCSSWVYWRATERGRPWLALVDTKRFSISIKERLVEWILSWDARSEWCQSHGRRDDQMPEMSPATTWGELSFPYSFTISFS